MRVGPGTTWLPPSLQWDAARRRRRGWCGQPSAPRGEATCLVRRAWAGRACVFIVLFLVRRRGEGRGACRSSPPRGCSARVRARPPLDRQVGVAACGPRLRWVLPRSPHPPTRRPIPRALAVVIWALRRLSPCRVFPLFSLVFFFPRSLLRLGCRPSMRGLPLGGIYTCRAGAAVSRLTLN